MTKSEIILYDLPKISLNEWYAGRHWSKRNKIKDAYKFIVKNQFKDVFKSSANYIVSYVFFFKNNPLDASNCSAMLKLIEDIIFEKDNYNIIDNINISSRKATDKKDSVYIEIVEL